MTQLIKPINIEISNINQKIEIDGHTYLLVKKPELEETIRLIKHYKAENQTQKLEIDALKDVVVDVIKLLGLYDEKTKSIKAEVREGKGFIMPIIKSLKDVGFLLAQSKMGFPGAEKELLEKFAFIKNILPLVDKYAGK